MRKLWISAGCLICSALTAVTVSAQGAPTATPTICKVQTVLPVRFHFMQTPLRNITPTPGPSHVPTATPTITVTPQGGGSGSGSDPVVQDAPGPTLGIEMGPSFEAVGEGFHGHDVNKDVPDANGDVGAYQYVQFTNTALAIFDKVNGQLVYGPAPGGTLFRDFGGPCEFSIAGDPIVLYDQLAHRWILTILASTGALGAVQCIAVSESEDATGRYYRYEYDMPLAAVPDYPKFGLWPDAYYYTAYLLGSELICAFDRSVMLQPAPTPGSLAQAQCCVTPINSNKYQSMLPADLDGKALPPAGEPNYLLNLDKATRSLQLWTFHANFAVPAQSQFLEL